VIFAMITPVRSPFLGGFCPNDGSLLGATIYRTCNGLCRLAVADFSQDQLEK
jgi:hypothetical protein